MMSSTFVDAVHQKSINIQENEAIFYRYLWININISLTFLPKAPNIQNIIKMESTINLTYSLKIIKIN